MCEPLLGHHMPFWTNGFIGDSAPRPLDDFCSSGEQARARARQGVVTKCVRTLPAAGRTTGSYISRISNEDVRCSAAAAKVSYAFRDRQGRVAKLPGNNVTRRCIFHPASLDLIAHQFPRRRGRLRHAWIGEAYKMADKAVVTNPIVFFFSGPFCVCK